MVQNGICCSRAHFYLATNVQLLSIFADKVFGYQASFGPTIDGLTLTDSVTRLFKNGKNSQRTYDCWMCE